MGFIAMFGAERLPLPKSTKALALFLCESNSKCETWDADGGANAAVLLETTPNKTGKGSALKLGSPTFEMDPAEHEGEVESPDFSSKLGGYPTWVQDPEVPTCSECDAAMEFALQFDEQLADTNFGDGGVAYVFVCEHAARMFWQCG
jgi:hypothetical protein